MDPVILVLFAKLRLLFIKRSIKAMDTLLCCQANDCRAHAHSNSSTQGASYPRKTLGQYMWVDLSCAQICMAR